MIWYLKEILNIIKYSFYILKKWYYSFLIDFIIISILSPLKINFFLKEKKVNIWSNKIIIPYNYVAFCVILEIFIFELYKNIQWLEHVLDLWWYVWDSAMYMSKINKKVTVVESDNSNFRLLNKNLNNIHNVVLINKAVVLDSSKDFYIIDDNIYWWTISKDTNECFKSKKIETISIDELMKNNNFDWLKLDIEWGEYDLINYFIVNDNFSFKKWFIEFHFFKNNFENAKQVFIEFINYLSNKGYIFDIFNNEGMIISNTKFITDLNQNNIKWSFVNLYFEYLFINP